MNPGTPQQDARDAVDCLTAMAREMVNQGLPGAAKTMGEHLDVLSKFVEENPCPCERREALVAEAMAE